MITVESCFSTSDSNIFEDFFNESEGFGEVSEEDGEDAVAIAATGTVCGVTSADCSTVVCVSLKAKVVGLFCDTGASDVDDWIG